MRRPDWLGAALTCLVLAGNGASAENRSAAELEQELATLRAQIETIREELAERRAERSSAHDAMARSEATLGEAIEALYRTRQELDAGRAREAELTRSIAGLEAQVRIQLGKLERQLQLAHRQGPHSRLQALLGSDDPAVVHRNMAMHGYLGRARLEQVETLRTQQRRMDELIEQQRSVMLQLTRVEATRALQIETEEAALDRRRAALRTLEREIANRAGQLEELRSAAVELETLLEQLRQALADVPPEIAVQPFASQRGLLSPPTGGALRAGFRSRRQADARWQGWLLDADPGSTVQAIAHGRVAWADWLRGYGMLVILDHGEEYMTLYGHNQALLVEAGDWVEPGQAIALAGDGGGGNPAGLYFQIRHRGQPVDPADWIGRDRYE